MNATCLTRSRTNTDGRVHLSDLVIATRDEHCFLICKFATKDESTSLTCMIATIDDDCTSSL